MAYCMYSQHVTLSAFSLVLTFLTATFIKGTI